MQTDLSIMKLYKTTLIIWSDEDHSRYEINFLAQDAIDGASYCSSRKMDVVENPKKDPDWDNTEFFDMLDEE